MLCRCGLQLHRKQLVFAGQSFVLFGFGFGAFALLLLASVSNSVDALAVGLVLLHQFTYVYGVLFHC